MLASKILKTGKVTRSGTAFAFMAATLLVGGSTSEASARPRHHQHYAHRHHHLAHARTGDTETASWGSSWRDANASVARSSGSGRSFSGVASFYGNESGSRTASGEHFNQNAMTCAHRSLPFGTKLRVSHGDRSVVVTVNDRGPFVRGRVLDLSKGAARVLGLGGVGRVTAEVI
jgi:rare lipoprotein A